MHAPSLDLKFDKNIVHAVYSGANEFVNWVLASKSILAKLNLHDCNLLLLIRNDSALSFQAALSRINWYETVIFPTGLKMAWVESDPEAKAQLQMMIGMFKIKLEVYMEVFDTTELASDWLLSD